MENIKYIAHSSHSERPKCVPDWVDWYFSPYSLSDKNFWVFAMGDMEFGKTLTARERLLNKDSYSSGPWLDIFYRLKRNLEEQEEAIIEVNPLIRVKLLEKRVKELEERLSEK